MTSTIFFSKAVCMMVLCGVLLLSTLQQANSMRVPAPTPPQKQEQEQHEILGLENPSTGEIPPTFGTEDEVRNPIKQPEEQNEIVGLDNPSPGAIPPPLGEGKDVREPSQQPKEQNEIVGLDNPSPGAISPPLGEGKDVSEDYGSFKTQCTWQNGKAGKASFKEYTFWVCSLGNRFFDLNTKSKCIEFCVGFPTLGFFSFETECCVCRNFS
eukprot:Nk52_evm6s2650 gene=Nk52_evmTU6s2650